MRLTVGGSRCRPAGSAEREPGQRLAIGRGLGMVDDARRVGLPADQDAEQIEMEAPALACGHRVEHRLPGQLVAALYVCFLDQHDPAVLRRDDRVAPVRSYDIDDLELQGRTGSRTARRRPPKP